MDRIKDLIKERGMTQQDFADKLEITRSALTQQLSGKPSLKTLEKMAEVLDVPVWQLFVSPEEIKPKELTALIHHRGDFYKANTIKELEEIVEKLRSKEK